MKVWARTKAAAPFWFKHRSCTKKIKYCKQVLMTSGIVFYFSPDAHRCPNVPRDIEPDLLVTRAKKKCSWLKNHNEQTRTSTALFVDHVQYYLDLIRTQSQLIRLARPATTPDGEIRAGVISSLWLQLFRCAQLWSVSSSTAAGIPPISTDHHTTNKHRYIA